MKKKLLGVLKNAKHAGVEDFTRWPTWSLVPGWQNRFPLNFSFARACVLAQGFGILACAVSELDTGIGRLRTVPVFSSDAAQATE